ncbi:MAG: ABC transporter substrate-binding protein [Arachnia sp.]
MSNGARFFKSGAAAFVGLSLAATMAGCSGSTGADPTAGGDGGDTVTLEFAQWWDPELPDGAFEALITQFEDENPGIEVELLSGPYASTKEQLFAGAAAGTMSDVVGLDGAWVSEFANQGAISDLTALMADYGYDDSQLASQIQVNGATYMIPVVNFVYPLYTNDAILAEAGVDAPPSNRSEFKDTAQAIVDNTDASGWALNLSLETPSGIQNSVMSWVWASGGSMLNDGQPDLTNDDVTSMVEYIQELYDAGLVAPGAFTMKEQDMVEEFTNGRVGLMVDSLAHVTQIRESNPDLEFSISAIPAVDGYEGERGIPYASWGIGVSANTEHPEESWKLVEFLMSAEVNGELSTVANAFPGNTEATPDFEGKDELFSQAFEIYQAGYPANEFTGLPVAEELMRQFGEGLQTTLDSEGDPAAMLEDVNSTWESEF